MTRVISLACNSFWCARGEKCQLNFVFVSLVEIQRKRMSIYLSHSYYLHNRLQLLWKYSIKTVSAEWLKKLHELHVRACIYLRILAVTYIHILYYNIILSKSSAKKSIQYVQLMLCMSRISNNFKLSCSFWGEFKLVICTHLMLPSANHHRAYMWT